ncbi:MAG: glycosyltransferase [Nitrospiraceae bacterium]|nr:glycosyltransferase [Nitrospiraceae bacterium]
MRRGFLYNNKGFPNSIKRTMTSIIVPIRNAPEQAAALLAKLKTQTVSDEIIIVDSSSGEGIQGSGGVRVLRIAEGEFDHGGTRSLAAGAAKGDIVVFFSQDALPADDLSVENLMKPFADASVAAAYGRQLPKPGASVFGAHLRLFNYPATSGVRSMADKARLGIKTPFLSNSFAAYRKEALGRVGGFRRRLIMGEDVCAGARLLMAGYKIAYVSDAEVYHSHDYTPCEEFRRYFDIGVFHSSERWLLETFGRPEGEGMQFIKSGVRYLAAEGKPWLVPQFLMRACLKYAGYALGRSYQRLPAAFVRSCSMHRSWWDAKGKP